MYEHEDGYEPEGAELIAGFIQWANANGLNIATMTIEDVIDYAMRYIKAAG